MRALWALAALLLGGCADEGEQKLKQAQERYEALVSSATHISDPGYDEVLAQLAKVPGSSKASPKARELERAIRGARAIAPPPPLAVAAPGDDEYAAQKRKCAELAMKLGLAPDAGRAQAQWELDACKKELLELEKAHFKEHH